MTYPAQQHPSGIPQAAGAPAPHIPHQGYAVPPPGTPGTGFPPHPGGYGRPGYPPPGWGMVPVSPSGQRLAEFSDRLLARLIDGAIIGGLAVLITIPVAILAVYSLSQAYDVGSDPDAGGGYVLALLGVYALVFALLLGLAYLYEVEWALRRGGQTVGKRAMKIRVEPLAPGTPLTRGMLGRRFLVHQGAGLLPGMGYLDGLWQLWDKPYRQCLHDKWAKTVVVKVAG